MFNIEAWEGWDAVRVGRYGECDFSAGVIRLAPQMDLQKSAATILHEILHAIWTVWGLTDEEEVKEERVITIFANGLATVMMDNPDLFVWITCVLRAKLEGNDR